MNAIELINFIRNQNLNTHALPLLVDGKSIVNIELIEDKECGYVFNIICDGTIKTKNREG